MRAGKKALGFLKKVFRFFRFYRLFVQRPNTTLRPGLFDMALKNLGFLGFLKNLKSPNLVFFRFLKK